MGTLLQSKKNITIEKKYNSKVNKQPCDNLSQIFKRSTNTEFYTRHEIKERKKKFY